MNTTNDRLKSAGQEDDERRHNDGSKEKARMTVQTVMQCEQGERPSIGNAESESRRSLENEDHGGERSSSSRRRKRRRVSMETPTKLQVNEGKDMTIQIVVPKPREMDAMVHTVALGEGSSILAKS